MGVLLECSGLTKRFGKREALKQVDLSVESGKIVGLLGPQCSKIHTESMIHYLEDYMYCTRKLGLYVQLVA